MQPIRAEARPRKVCMPSAKANLFAIVPRRSLTERTRARIGMKLLQKVKADFDEVAKVEYEPRMEGRQMIMILAPR